MASGTRTWQRRGAALAVGAMLLTGCWGGGDDDAGSPSDSTQPTSTTIAEPIVSVAGVPPTDQVPVAQLGLRLSQGAPIRIVDDVEVVDGDPLTEAELTAIFERLTAWVVPAADPQDFSRPAETLLPPLVGDPIATPFPPLGDGDSVDLPDPGDLHVLRFQPEGPVDVAPFLSVTFDQPMVPLATLDQLDAADVPVRITPEVEGRWRWIGTRTVRFEVVPGSLDRFPASTNYEVEIPAGTEATNGATLTEAVTWSFTTPTPTVSSFVGASDSLPLTPVFVAVFDQRVDPEAVLAVTTITAGGVPWPVRLATPTEIAADEAARNAVDAALDSRSVAFRPITELPADTDLKITIGPDTPSAEGPLTSTSADTHRARTFGQLEIADTSCDWGSGCTPGVPFTIRFSNPLDPEAFSADQVSVSPPIPGLRINVYGDVIDLTGLTAGRTTYTVELSGDLQDIFGQTLGNDESIEFDVGSAPPELRGLDRQWITTDPTADKPLVSVSTINHDSIHVIAWAVSPANLAEYRDYLERQWSNADATTPEWQVVYDEVIEIDAEPDQWAETAIDLSSPFNQTGSQLVVRVEPTRVFSDKDEDYWRNRPTSAWVQKTTLGVDAFFDDQNLVIWTTDLTTGKPVGGVPVELIGDGRIATTDEEGLAELELGPDGVLGLWANGGDRTAFLPADWWEGWKAGETSDESRWYIFDDRGIYRPGETVRITGWVRRFARTEDAQLALYDGDVTVSYQARDPQGNQIGDGTVDLNPLGGFNLTIDVPEGSNLGQASIDFQLDGPAASSYGGGYHGFQVQDFRTPEFEVTARNESAGPHYTAQPTTVAVDAQYYSGGPLPDAEVNWLVGTSTTTYSPPNWDTFTFGIWQPWWYGGYSVSEDSWAGFADDCFDCGPGYGATEYEQFSGRTDAEGTHYLQIDFDGPDVDLPTSVTAEATVFDVNRQAWASRTSLLIHPAQYYVGVRSDRTFVERGQPMRIDAVVTDVDGALVAGRSVDIVAGRLDWVLANGTWSEQVVDQTTCTIMSTDNATDESMRCEFATDVGGTYRITAIVVDDSGHSNRSELTQWVTGGEGRPNRNVELESVNIVPDHETYAPGDTAQLLVQSPFSPATGLVTVLRQGIESTFTFETEDGSAVVEIPIEDAQIPNLTVQIDMVGSAVRTADNGTPLPDLPPRTAYASGQIALSIPPVTRTLEVIATPAAKAVEPGDDTTVTVQVRGPDGEPVSGADVAILVVDEAVLSLTGYQLIDPLSVFYQQVWSNLNAQYTRSSVQLARSDLVTTQDGADRTGVPASDDTAAAEEPASESAADGELQAGGGEPSTGAIDLRTDFDPLAMYAPEESTGVDGTVTVDVPLPDNLTRYRVMAVAVDGVDHFGKGESTITARLPLQVRPSAPRFLNFGDRFELPVVLQNQTDQPLVVEVALQVANLAIVGPAGRRVTVPPNDRIEVRFPVTTDQAGTARFRVVTVSGEYADAAELELPVYTPATAEAFATYGVIDEGAVAQPMLAPTDVFPQFGGLEIGTSSTALQALTDAVLYLVEYRFDSADGYASRIMAIAALRDVLDAFDAVGLPEPAELDLQVNRDVAQLAALQNDDGGFPYWQRGRQSIPWQSIQSTHALVLAHDAGYLVPAPTLNSALDHLADIEQYYPADYGEQIRNTLSAYALYVRGEAGGADIDKATDLYRSVGDDLELDAVAWLWPSITDPGLRDEIERRFVNSAVETANAVTFATGYDEDAYVIAQSERKTDGIILDALITETPDSDLIVKTVNGLLGNQTRGRWNNAHENAFILLALNRYFNTFESITPDFVARAWLGDLYAFEHRFLDRTTERASSLVPMSELVNTGDTDLIVQKDGEGRLYYRLGLRYAPSDLKLDAADEGFVVDRVYEGVDDPADVTRDANGVWHITAGASVRVRLTMVADARRTHVALIDPLPAGLEPVNPALLVSQTTPPDDSDVASPYDWFWSWNWFEHQNLRDDRAEAFTSYLPGGIYEYTYIARATTPGEFVVPPARAEEVYAPEVFGRSGSATVIID